MQEFHRVQLGIQPRHERGFTHAWARFFRNERGHPAIERSSEHHIRPLLRDGQREIRREPAGEDRRSIRQRDLTNRHAQKPLSAQRDVIKLRRLPARLLADDVSAEMRAQHRRHNLGTARRIAIHQHHEQPTPARVFARSQDFLIVHLGPLDGKKDAPTRSKSAADLRRQLEVRARRCRPQIQHQRRWPRCKAIQRLIQRREILRAERAEPEVSHAALQHLAAERTRCHWAARRLRENTRPSPEPIQQPLHARPRERRIGERVWADVVFAEQRHDLLQLRLLQSIRRLAGTQRTRRRLHWWCRIHAQHHLWRGFQLWHRRSSRRLGFHRHRIRQILLRKNGCYKEQSGNSFLHAAATLRQQGISGNFELRTLNSEPCCFVSAVQSSEFEVQSSKFPAAPLLRSVLVLSPPNFHTSSPCKRRSNSPSAKNTSS